VLSVIVLVMGIAFLAGTLPAVRAARQNPIDALRYE
jgi:putative ABC transport system permease protein